MKNAQLALLVLTTLGLQNAVEAEQVAPELGTLFYTPAQRQEISRARGPETTLEVSDSTYLQGVVRRSQGKGTVWVNGKPLPEGQAHTPLIQGVDAVVDGKRLQVGQSLNKFSGTRTDLVAPGAVTKRKPQ